VKRVIAPGYVLLFGSLLVRVATASLFSTNGEAKCLELNAWEMTLTKFASEERP